MSVTQPQSIHLPPPPALRDVWSFSAAGTAELAEVSAPAADSAPQRRRRFAGAYASRRATTGVVEPYQGAQIRRT